MDEAKTYKVALGYQLIRTRCRLTFEVDHLSAEECDFTASNGVRIVLTTGLQGDRLTPEGLTLELNREGRRLPSATLVYANDGDRDETALDIEKALAEWAESIGEVTTRIPTPTPREWHTEVHEQQQRGFEDSVSLLTRWLEPSPLQLIVRQRELFKMRKQLEKDHPESDDTQKKLRAVLTEEAAISEKIANYVDKMGFDPVEAALRKDEDPTVWMKNALKQMREQVADRVRKNQSIVDTEAEVKIRENFWHVYVNNEATTARRLALGWRHVECGLCGGSTAVGEPLR